MAECKLTLANSSGHHTAQQDADRPDHRTGLPNTQSSKGAWTHSHIHVKSLILKLLTTNLSHIPCNIQILAVLGLILCHRLPVCPL